jgi:threonine dehydratase
VVPHDVAPTIADGMACRIPVQDALDTIRAGVERVVEVTDDEIGEAMRELFSASHNVAEGAGAASLAALLKERESIAFATAGIVLTGANVDPEPFARILGRNPL